MPRPQLFMAWRLLHGRNVGRAVGETLLEDCCDTAQGRAYGSETAAWTAARSLVAGAPPVATFLRLDRAGPDYTTIPTCFADAFDVAAATLKDRVGRYGAQSLAVRNWLMVQDAVFAGCATAGVALPASIADPPAWLRADRAYQEAALALYDRDFDGAARRFAAIGHDARSPWQPWRPYLQARALFRRALTTPSPDNLAAARVALTALAAMPAGMPGQAANEPMRRAIAFRERPAALQAQLEAELAAPTLRADAARSFRDLADLASPSRPSETIAWMAAIKLAHVDYSGEDPAGVARRNALTQAVARWRTTQDAAWLVAALTLVDAGDADASELIAAAQAIPLGAPAGLSARYHHVRLTLAAAPAALSRARLDPVLARSDLSNTDRNLFRAERAAVAEDLPAFARFALRTASCATEAPGCSDRWSVRGMLDSSSGGVSGLGSDAEAIIDRLPLRERVELAADRSLAAPLQLDIALTSWARAVQLQDDAVIDTLSRRLTRLLPVMARDFARVVASPPGVSKRFAEFFILAKIPGIRTDFPDYLRPEGAVSQFQYYWTDWLILPRGRRLPAGPPALSRYLAASGGRSDDLSRDSDLYCLGLCGAGAAPLRLPDFAAAGATRAAGERGAFVAVGRDADGKALPAPRAAVAAWDEMLDYIARHPADARAPEALHWLVHVGRYGGSHEHSGRRAFMLLKRRYPQTAWAKKNRFFYD